MSSASFFDIECRLPLYLAVLSVEVRRIEVIAPGGDRPVFDGKSSHHWQSYRGSALVGEDIAPLVQHHVAGRCNVDDLRIDLEGRADPEIAMELAHIFTTHDVGKGTLSYITSSESIVRASAMWLAPQCPKKVVAVSRGIVWH